MKASALPTAIRDLDMAGTATVGVPRTRGMPALPGMTVTEAGSLPGTHKGCPYRCASGGILGTGTAVAPELLTESG
ncbi:hypothetical protein Desti_1675 [Desulfomonile tiedjei DSM 6799]|uniref:Uncharacterized protein n=1 Tax=Desulfomonile tiedjei (strain ATCC 49306 / DSM 6799 / DCB-1) TaxID=706587 RepID=I4C495_DESTA|nr:hypothetical protein Desti_1675 [Desulfomonile tiedjei DSM 6799]